MIEHRITFTEEELVASATQDNLSILALTKFLRSLPNDQRGFFKDRCKYLTTTFASRYIFSCDQETTLDNENWKDWTFRAFLEVIFEFLYTAIRNILTKILHL